MCRRASTRTRTRLPRSDSSSASWRDRSFRSRSSSSGGLPVGRTGWAPLSAPACTSHLCVPSLHSSSQQGADQRDNPKGLPPFPELPYVLLPELPNVRGVRSRRQRPVPFGYGLAIPALWRQVLPSARSWAWVHVARRRVGAHDPPALRESLALLSSFAFCFFYSRSDSAGRHEDGPATSRPLSLRRCCVDHSSPPPRPSHVLPILIEFYRRALPLSFVVNTMDVHLI